MPALWFPAGIADENSGPELFVKLLLTKIPFISTRSAAVAGSNGSAEVRSELVRR